MPDRRLAAALRARIARRLRRHRRPFAAALAGVAALVALTAVRAEPATVPAGDAAADASIRNVPPGEVIVPVPLRIPGIAGVLHVGDVVDVVALPADEAASASVVASGAAVVELPSGGSGLTGSSTTVVLVSVDEDEALPLSAAAVGGGLTVVIRDR